ncbi:hypothetical protein MAPG_09497 [Magnaporthiopsis poae ATCC 64411]|uniref:Uncharacterized protein n=1 Tax=Magnaporthiopsis poae (strain ATCC 64411 / 73-15) TaxID=644358 RepID=A0A0C4EA41_MAGP6|nr:hypothetical protein MAPG_09497 [Magnaporthiopsis poae ATCC 64411]
MHFTTAILLTLPILAMAAPRPAHAIEARAPAPALAPSTTAEQPTVTIERRAHARSFAQRRRRHDRPEPFPEAANADTDEPVAAASIVPRSHPRAFGRRRRHRTGAKAPTAEQDMPVAIPRPHRAHARAIPAANNRRSDEAEDEAAELEERSHGVVGTPLATRSNERNHPRAWVTRSVN